MQEKETATERKKRIAAKLLDTDLSSEDFMWVVNSLPGEDTQPTDTSLPLEFDHTQKNTFMACGITPEINTEVSRKFTGLVRESKNRSHLVELVLRSGDQRMVAIFAVKGIMKTLNDAQLGSDLENLIKNLFPGDGPF